MILDSFIEHMNTLPATSIQQQDDGSYSLDFQSVVVCVQESQGDIRLCTSLGPVGDLTEEICVLWMEANLLGKETDRQVLGLNESKTEVTMTSFIYQPLAYGEFYDALESFVNYAEAWKEQIQSKGC